MCLIKVQRVKYLNGVFRKLIMLIFLGLKTFCQIFPKENLDVCFSLLEENFDIPWASTNRNLKKKKLKKKKTKIAESEFDNQLGACEDYFISNWC
jgi:hypothetical protein